MAYLGNQPLLSTMRTVAEGTAYANQTEIPVPGGVVSGMVDVVVNGATLNRDDYDDSNGASIKLYVPMVVGSSYRVTAWTPNQTSVNAGGQLASFRNRIINGNFDIWQRGTAIGASSGVVRGADRWILESNLDGGSYLSGAGFGRNTFTLGQTQVPGNPTYFATVKGSITGGNQSNAYWVVGHKIEDVRTHAGGKATLSMWLDCSVARTAKLQFVQNFGTGGSPSTAVRFGTQDIVLNGGNGTQFKQYSISVDVPSITGKTLGTNGDDHLDIYIWMQAGATVGASVGVGTITDASPGSTLYIAQVQFEAGGVATQFEQRPIGLEFALCQRYYQRHTIGQRMYAPVAGAYCSSPVMFPVQLRGIPSIALVVAGTLAANTPLNIVLTEQTVDQARFEFSSTTSGDCYVTGRVYEMIAEL